MTRDRIKELVRVPANTLRRHPGNWRRHPKNQAALLRTMLGEVGFADAVIARRLADGALELIDGHLRADVMGAALVPVLVLDVDEAEAAKLLVTIDPLSALAEADITALATLANSLSWTATGLAARLQSLWTAKRAGAGAGAAPGAPGLQAPFSIAPSSVLDARAGDWQARKSAWLALGIQSELGRDVEEVPNPKEAYEWARKHSAAPGGAKWPARHAVDGRFGRADLHMGKERG